MSKRLQPRVQRAAITGLVCFGLLLAACTRSATTATVPTAGPTGLISGTESKVVQPSDQDATMNAIGTQVSGQLTQTAVATAGGQGQTPAAPGTTAQPGATDTLQPGQPTSQPGQTPGGPQPTQPAASTPVPPSGAPCPNPYTVQSGDWIYKIARNCNVSVAALIAANPGIDPNVISPGQQLNMPAQGGATPASAGDPTGSGCSGQHVVVTGESLYRIAYVCGLTVERLAATNGITYPYTIYIGQVLTIR